MPVFRGILSRATSSFSRITQRNPRIEFIGIPFPFNQGFLFSSGRGEELFQFEKYFDLSFAILLRKMIQLFFLLTDQLIYTSEDLCLIFRRQQIFPLSSFGVKPLSNILRLNFEIRTLSPTLNLALPRLA